MRKLKSDSADRLFEAILTLENVEECYDFFEDLCTVTEIKDMVQRFDTARLISVGISYQKISEKTGVSTATISRVSRCLHYGSGGYKRALDALKESGDRDE